MSDKIVVINDIQFEFTLNESKKAVEIFGKLMQAVGPMLKEVEGLDFNKLSAISQENVGDLPPDILSVVGALLSKVKPADLEYFRSEFAKYTKYVGPEGNEIFLKNEVNFNKLFGSNILFMGNWMFKFAQVNFFSGVNS